MGAFQSVGSVPNLVQSIQQAPTVGIEVASVHKQLNDAAKIYSGSTKSPFIDLMSIMTYGASTRRDNLMLGEYISNIKPNLAQSSSFEKRTFLKLANQHTFILRDMYDCVFHDGIYIGEADIRFDLAKIAFDYYGVPKEYLFLLAVKLYSGHPEVANYTSSLKFANDKKVLKEWVIWVMDKDVVNALVKGQKLAGAMFAEWLAEPMDSVIQSVLFRTMYDILPYNISYSPQNGGATISLASLVVNQHSSPVTPFVVSVLYPAIPTPPFQVPNDYEFFEEAFGVAIGAGATLEQLNRIYPSLDERPSHQMVDLDFDFIMTAATAARLDVMEAYGFGPSFLAYLDTNNVSVEDFLRKCQPSIRLAVGRILGLTDRETLEYTKPAERPYTWH